MDTSSEIFSGVVAMFRRFLTRRNVAMRNIRTQPPRIPPAIMPPGGLLRELSGVVPFAMPLVGTGVVPFVCNVVL